MKTKKPLTLSELRQKWSEGGKKRAALLTKEQRDKISRKGARARKKQAKAAREAKARTAIETLVHYDGNGQPNELSPAASATA